MTATGGDLGIGHGSSPSSTTTDWSCVLFGAAALEILASRARSAEQAILSLAAAIERSGLADVLRSADDDHAGNDNDEGKAEEAAAG
uniref:Uncharacterized protein n=1 Tax=viral metagenome TaxID=1070528 RepID=A0A6M3J908_9ZZZZ